MKLFFDNKPRILLCFTFQFFACNALAVPSVQQIGELLGYPEREIVVKNITGDERKLWENPTARERRQGVPMPDSQRLIAAYKVTGRTASTFFPMIIWIGAKGAFLDPKTQRTLDLIASSEPKPISEGGRGPFGSQSFEGLGNGGIYLGKIKIPSTVREMSEPQEKMAMISVMYQPSRQLDYRIAFMTNLEGSVDLELLPGGEEYFRKFSMLSDDEVEPRYDVGKLFSNLNRLVDTDPTPDEVSPSPPLQQDGPANLPKIQTNGSIQNSQQTAQAPEGMKPQPKEFPWLWLVGLIAVVSVLGFGMKSYRTKRS